ncbi:Chalcone_isomerase domain-containing protein [Durusdinium trenchii]|uniref:Chalcone_isomerase domain-containing protein n=1 Tax=Durusdinium trenchii TaxID=1381693 RepID=A0ABP0QI03_9DINO
MVLVFALVFALVLARSRADFETWDPVPFRPISANSADEIPVGLEERRRVLAEREAFLLQAGLQVQEWKHLLANRSREVRCRKEIFRRHWADQEVAVLHLIVFRLVQIQATAEVDVAGRSPPHGSANVGVEVIVCIKNLKAVAGDFPVHDVLRALTVLPVTNICRTAEPGTDVLDRLATFLDEAPKSSTLYLVVFATNVFFNDLPDRSGPEAIRARYQALSPSLGEASGHVVVGTARFCGEACEVEDPPYLDASGLLGPKQSLQRLVHSLMHESQSLPSGQSPDLSHLLRSYIRKSFKQTTETSWGPSIVLDREQSIFGHFGEVASGLCADGRNWCSMAKPCCAISNRFRHLHEAFYGRYTVEECAVVRDDGKEPKQWPILWSGDGTAKWMYLLALDALAVSCQPVARLVLLSHPKDHLERLFSAFEATQTPGSIAPRATEGS